VIGLNLVSNLINSLSPPPQDFLNASEITHLKKQAAIMNLSNDVIVNKNFIHKEEEKTVANGTGGVLLLLRKVIIT